MVELSPIFRKAYWGLAATGAAYAAFLLCLTNVTIQRNALYANKIVSAWWVDINKPESFGFAKNQVTAFNITTPDLELLSAWHILPLDVYAEHEEELLSEPSGPVDDFFRTKAFRLLTEDPDSRIVINCNLAQGYRTDTYRSITSLPHTHLVTIDYRGFGSSTGTPTERGLITDAIALTTYIHTTLSIPSHRILILGQSLGTAVAAATALHFADPAAASSLLPGPSPDADADADADAEAQPSNTITETSLAPTDFAAIILVAPFTSLPALVMTYRILGLIPLLSPLRAYPRLQNYLRARIIDVWDTSARITALVAATAFGSGASDSDSDSDSDSATATAAAAAAAATRARHLHLHILHAKNDFDIPRRHGEALYRVASLALGLTSDVVETGEARVVQGEVAAGEEGEAETGTMGWRRRRSDGGGREVLLDVLAWGGHNRIVTFAPVQLAVLRGFESAGGVAAGGA